MPITIHWIDPQVSDIRVSKIRVVSGELMVYRIEESIVKTMWCLQHSPLNESSEDAIIRRYLNDSTTLLTVNLQRQGSDFCQKVWAEICKIPAGQVLNYSDIAENIHSGARAVANACRHNVFPGLIPCHRVVAKNGLGGFMGKTHGDAMALKKKLLAMEAIFANT